ncbi:sugar phosphate nucleotidyltransferase [Alkalihalobacillus sp. CinArs1]|uniref:sugar phosphate nucleotidyltransferase n=1 Tax=Alkalihalobacillus sp. CinArs1 TaxID=2995314 RepID=UPI0022DE44F9|nr:sugar phosphate nucleotidyltransferase [Alkalihalobacillus sp. CinArs1]
MNVVLLSGGSGQRLWPLSNDSRSKQFLKILSSEGGNQSMAQRVWGQLKKAQLSSSTLISTSKSQVDMIIDQIGRDVPLVIEPERRDTFPAIALAAAYLYSVKSVLLEEVVTVLPVDPYVDDAFFQTIKELEHTVINSKANLALIGALPTHPSEKYGYIVPDQHESSPYMNVKQFMEKPKEEVAQSIIKENGLWNCGVFAFKLDYIISYLQQNGFPIQYDELLKSYHLLPKKSFDYEIVEKEPDIVVLPYKGFWKDLGTWNTLTEEMKTHQIGPGKACERSINTHIINELDIPVAVLGISNTVVVASHDGILVTEKEASPTIKSVLSSIEKQARYKELSWGWWKELDRSYADDEVLTRKVVVKGGKHLTFETGHDRTVTWNVTKGTGSIQLQDSTQIIQPGVVFSLKAGESITVRTKEEVEIIEIQRGSKHALKKLTYSNEKWEEVEKAISL